MDSLLRAGEEFLQNQGGGNQGGGYQGGGYQGDGNQGGGFDGSNQQHRGNFGAGGFNVGDMEGDFQQAHQAATSMSGNSGNGEMFANALGNISQKRQHLQNQDIDEEDAVRQHQQTYNNDAPVDNHSIGTAAAMQALKSFTSGGGGQSQGDFMGMAMSEASQLFESKSSQGLMSGGSDKQACIQKAGEMALQMYMKSQGGGGGLMSLASKLM